MLQMTENPAKTGSKETQIYWKKQNQSLGCFHENMVICTSLKAQPDHKFISPQSQSLKNQNKQQQRVLIGWRLSHLPKPKVLKTVQEWHSQMKSAVLEQYREAIVKEYSPALSPHRHTEWEGYSCTYKQVKKAV